LQKAEAERSEDLIEIPVWLLQLVGIPMVSPVAVVDTQLPEVLVLAEVSMPEVQHRATLEIMLAQAVVAQAEVELVRPQEITVVLAELV
jgi:hypothetical protein